MGGQRAVGRRGIRAEPLGRCERLSGKRFSGCVIEWRKCKQGPTVNRWPRLDLGEELARGPELSRVRSNFEVALLLGRSLRAAPVRWARSASNRRQHLQLAALPPPPPQWGTQRVSAAKAKAEAAAALAPCTLLMEFVRSKIRCRRALLPRRRDAAGAGPAVRGRRGGGGGC